MRREEYLVSFLKTFIRFTTQPTMAESEFKVNPDKQQQKDVSMKVMKLPL